MKFETPAAKVRITVAVVIAAIINSSTANEIIIEMANFRSNLVTNFDQGFLG